MDWLGTIPHELESGQIIGAHSRRADCKDEKCSLHHPSYHALVFHPRWWEPQTQTMWRVCGCEILHPDVDMRPADVCRCKCRCCVRFGEDMLS